MTGPHLDQWQLLRKYIVAAVQDLPDPDDRSYIAALLDAGRYDVMAEFDLNEDDQPDPRGCWYKVVLNQSDGTIVPLVRVHYTRLGVTDDEAEMELACVLAQQEHGIPDDISELDES